MTRVGEILWNDILPRTPVFTTAEVAELGDLVIPYVSRSLSALADDGQVTRVRRGLWALSGHPDFSPYVVVPYLFEGEDAG